MNYSMNNQSKIIIALVVSLALVSIPIISAAATFEQYCNSKFGDGKTSMWDLGCEKIIKLEKYIDKLEIAVSELQVDISVLESDNSELQTTLSELQSIVKSSSFSSITSSGDREFVVYENGDYYNSHPYFHSDLAKDSLTVEFNFKPYYLGNTLPNGTNIYAYYDWVFPTNFEGELILLNETKTFDENYYQIGVIDTELTLCTLLADESISDCNPNFTSTSKYSKYDLEWRIINMGDNPTNSTRIMYSYTWQMDEVFR